MNKIVIIIPSRLDAFRLPNKPLELINKKEMILHVYEAAKKTNMGDIYVATPDQKIVDVIANNGGKAILTSLEHQTGTDRVYEVFKNELKTEPSIIVNLQGDMPNIDTQAISDLVSYMNKNQCDIGTLASSFSSETDLSDENNVKVAVKDKLTVRQTEELVKDLKEGNPAIKNQKQVTNFIQDSIPHLNTFFGHKIAISANAKGKGKMTIPFSSEEDFNRIKNLLK
jgi:3-deoxy-manno-octulosonate cytidylyltransferase (CMP-KDO synthetase)